jgi:hypothetical protein
MPANDGGTRQRINEQIAALAARLQRDDPRLEEMAARAMAQDQIFSEPGVYERYKRAPEPPPKAFNAAEPPALTHEQTAAQEIRAYAAEQQLPGETLEQAQNRILETNPGVYDLVVRGRQADQAGIRPDSTVWAPEEPPRQMGEPQPVHRRRAPRIAKGLNAEVQAFTEPGERPKPSTIFFALARRFEERGM